jgi:Protein of unknown function (DUF1566)
MRPARQLVSRPLIVSTLLLFGVSGAQGAFTTAPCLAGKLKATGRLQQCQAVEGARTLQGVPADIAKCTTKFLATLAKLDAKASESAIRCRYGINGDGTVTDYDTGLMWEQKTGTIGNVVGCSNEPICPAANFFVGSYSTTLPSSGTLRISVLQTGTSWTGTADDSVLGHLTDLAGAVSGNTLTGSGDGGAITLTGTLDCGTETIVGAFGGSVGGSWSVTNVNISCTNDPHNVNNVYTWFASLGGPAGPAFTSFLVKLNTGISTDSVTTTGCFAGHCDWRLPSITELAAIMDLNAPGCGSGSACIDMTNFGPTLAEEPEGDFTVGYGYWSATSATGPFDAWLVFYGAPPSGVGLDNKTMAYPVRAVRAAW